MEEEQRKSMIKGLIKQYWYHKSVNRDDLAEACKKQVELWCQENESFESSLIEYSM
ncbi:MAG: hypothetical protein K0S26_1411 [Bacteroidota bacterium]|jgi:hypothetical protein|nr:hypothetical protein [Bacteroidota bacterium]